MLILLFVIFVGLFILGSKYIDEEHFLFKILVQMCTVFGTVIVIFCFVNNCYSLSKTIVIDDTIAMYTDENKNIESQIDTIVARYMDYEGDTFSELKNNDAISLVSLYPELKTDELVQTQIATYQANSAKLKELKETKIKAKIYKWWLYFGR